MGNGDNNAWAGLARQAHDGTLELAPGAARQGAKLAAVAANALAFAKSYQDLLTTHRGFSDNKHLDQILILQRRFNDQGRALGTILDRYIELVDAMADTMIQADKTYDAAEEDSKTKFNRLKKEADVADTDPGRPVLATGKIPDPGGDSAPRIDRQQKGHPDLYKIAHERGHYDAIDPENPFTGDKDLDWFYEAGAGMYPQVVADFGATWKKVADKVDKSFDALTGQLGKMVDDKAWSSAGARSAVAAANAFKSQAGELTSDMRAMASNLTYVSGWLENTMLAMPRHKPNDFDYQHVQRMENMIKSAQLAFQNWYVPGLIGASQAVPKLSDPTVEKPELGGPSPRSDVRGGGGNPSPKNQLGPVTVPVPKPQNTNPNATDPTKKDPHQKNPGGTDPNGSNPNGSNPNGSNPNGSKPDGSDPKGSNPSGSNPSGTGQNSSTSSQSGQGLSQLSSALQQGMQSLSSLQNSTQQTKKQDLKDQLTNTPLSGLPSLLDDLKKDGLGGGGGGGGGGGAPTKPVLEPSRLFPRAAPAVETVEAAGVTGVSRAGVAAGTSSMGGMGGMGPMGHGAGHGAAAGGKDHKRPEFLDSTEYLDEAMGTPPIVAKPVVEG